MVYNLCCCLFIHSQSAEGVLVKTRGAGRSKPAERVIGSGHRLYWWLCWPVEERQHEVHSHQTQLQGFCHKTVMLKITHLFLSVVKACLKAALM